MSCKYHMHSSFSNFSKAKIFSISLVKDFILKMIEFH